MYAVCLANEIELWISAVLIVKTRRSNSQLHIQVTS